MLDQMRRKYVMKGLAIFIIIAQLSAILISLVVSAVYPSLGEKMWFAIVLSPVCFYLIALPIAWISIRRAPVCESNGPVRKRMTVKAFFMFFIVGLAFMYIANLFTQGVVYVIEHITGAETGNVVEDIFGGVSPVITVLFAVVIGPVMEEIVFRGIVLRRLLYLGDKKAIIISALAFGLFHCNLTQIFYAAALGIVFGYVAVRYGRTIYTIILHMMINLLGGVLMPMAVSTQNTFLVGMIGLTVIAVIILGGILFFANRAFIELYPAPACENAQPEPWAVRRPERVWEFFFKDWGLVFTLFCVLMMIVSLIM